MLELLATTSRPLSSYRIAKVTGTEPIRVSKVLAELNGLVTRTDEGWEMIDMRLRDFIREQTLPDLSAGRPNRYLREAVKELRRSPEQDAILAKYGARTSDESRRR